jgi:hypothetical protein
MAFAEANSSVIAWQVLSKILESLLRKRGLFKTSLQVNWRFL